MDNLDQFKCTLCHTIPTDPVVYRCCNGHLICPNCSKENHYLCACLEVITEKTNPLIEKLQSLSVQTTKKTQCDYNGCLFNESMGDVELHIKECRYRPYECAGAVLKLWNCDFKGRHRDIPDHILHDHDAHHRAFTQYQTASIPFIEDQSYGTLNLIQAYNHDFIFYFYSNHKTQQMLFSIYCMGKRKTANRFYYELTIKSPAEKFRQLKMTEKCFSDTDLEITAGLHLNPQLPHVVNLSHNTVKEHLKDDHIHFQFKLIEVPKKPVPAPPIPVAKKKEKPKEKPKPKKEIKKINLKKIPSGIPNAPEGGGPKKPNEEAELANLPPGQVPPNLQSSINKTPPTVAQKPSPCLSPSINKNEKTSPFQFPPRGEPSLQTNYMEIQTYKDPKSGKYVQQLYPSSSLSKPVIKK